MSNPRPSSSTGPSILRGSGAANNSTGMVRGPGVSGNVRAPLPTLTASSLVRGLRSSGLGRGQAQVPTGMQLRGQAPSSGSSPTSVVPVRAQGPTRGGGRVLRGQGSGTVMRGQGPSPPSVVPLRVQGPPAGMPVLIRAQGPLISGTTGFVRQGPSGAGLPGLVPGPMPTTSSSGLDRMTVPSTVSTSASVRGPGPASASTSSGLVRAQEPFPIGVTNLIRAMTPTMGPNGPIKRARRTMPITNGKVSSWEDKSSDFLCPICLNELKEAHITQCGHTYCRACIVATIDRNEKCPKCAGVVTKEELIPNFVLNHLVARQRTLKAVKVEMAEAGKPTLFTGPAVFKFLTSNYDDLNLGDVDVLLAMLTRKKEVLTTEDQEHQRHLLLEFLKELLRIKQSQKAKLDREVCLISRDLGNVKDLKPSGSASNACSHAESSTSPDDTTSCSSSKFEGFTTSIHKCTEIEQTTLAARKSRIHTHFDELTNMYLTNRRAEVFDDRVTSNEPMIVDEESRLTESDVLSDFGTALARISRYHALKPLATLSYNADLLSNSNIVSSIEFDKDNEFFAIAGVTKKIKLFEYSTVLGACVDIHHPSAELSCEAKISCVAWSGYYKNNLASSDYTGHVNLWDSGSATKIRTLDEHEKRVWSVDWSNGDPRLLASGSDDAKVKLWATNQERSVASLDAKANVCCVKFCPENSFILAFGSADHCIHYYDFRQPREALGILVGHHKAVSYVKFASKYELVSASTDSNLKLWDMETMENVRSFRGHTNEKNFVGLATDGNFIACGSENNSLYIYYKSLPKPLFSFKFDNHRGMLEKPRTDESTEFVSAVAWKKGSAVVVAANSQGAIKVLELV